MDHDESAKGLLIALGAILSLALLPAVVIGALVAAWLRHARWRHTRLAVAVLTCAGAIADLVEARAAARLYLHGYEALVNGAAIRIVDTLPLAIPIGGALGLIGAWAWGRWRSTRPRKPTPVERAPELRPSRRILLPRPSLLVRAATPLAQALARLPVPDSALDEDVPLDEGAPDVLVVARRGRRLVQAEHHATVIAATGTGKTRGLVIPLVLDWPGPVVVTSTKLDVVVGDPRFPGFRGTLGARLRRGACWGFSPTTPELYSYVPRLPWDPLWRIRRAGTPDERRRAASDLASAMAEAVGQGQRDTQTDPMWTQQARAVLAAACETAAAEDASVADVATWVDRLMVGDAAVEEKLTAHGMALVSVAETRQGVLANAQAIIAPWRGFPETTEPWSPAQWAISTDTIYLVSVETKDDAKAVMTVLVGDLMTSLVEARRLSPRALLALDEAANVAPIPHLDRMVTATREVAHVVTVWQSIAQMALVYGEGASKTVVANSSTLVFPTADDATLNWLQAVLGEVNRRRESTSHRPHLLGPRTGRSRSVAPERLAHALELQRLPGALLIAPSEGASLVEPRFWDQDRTLAPLGALDPVEVVRELGASEDELNQRRALLSPLAADAGLSLPAEEDETDDADDADEADEANAHNALADQDDPIPGIFAV